MADQDPPGLDLARLGEYLSDTAPHLVSGPLSAAVLPGGKSNLTYLVRGGGQHWVLRRPPLGHVLATAHDMAREYRVMTALGPTPVPVPATLLLCPDPEVLGAPFYLMEQVGGTVYRTAGQTAALGPDRAHALAFALVDVLADLHEVDPVAVGLGDFGRPAGFLGRQVRRWRTQLDASRSRDLPGIDELHAGLAGAVPSDAARPAIVHGDYRLDNLLVGADDRIAAVLDWEMATLGDPLADLGLLLVYWDSMAELPDNPITDAVGRVAGFPPGAALADRYAGRRGTDLSTLDWYLALGFFKLAVIAEGIHYRYTLGQTVGDGFAHMGELVAPLVERGLAALKGR